MYLKQLWLHQYKNHPKSDFEFVDGINALYGPNGVGKTNVLDAIHYLCNGKSYFTKTDSKVITKGESELSVKGLFVGEEGLTDEVLVNFSSDRKKGIKRNQKRYKRLIDHVGQFPVVMVTPTDVNLIYDDSKERRRFMDLVLCQTDPQYIQMLSDYKRLLEARNKILRQMAEQGYTDTTLVEGYTEKMIAPASYLHGERKAFIERIAPLFREVYEKIAGEPSAIGFTYANDLEGMSFPEQLERYLSADIRAGRTTHGIHRDDLLFLLDDEALKKFASQGQIKSFLIAVKIAQFDYLYEKTGKKPLLLLDDIYEKIDEDRAQNLMEMVSESHFGQIFISDTHESRLEKHIYNLKSGIKTIPLKHA